MCYDGNDNQDRNDDYDCNSNSSLGMDIHSSDDIKYYLITLALSIITMLVLKFVWNFTKFLSIHIVKTIDDLNYDRILKRHGRKAKENLIARVDSLRSNEIDKILYVNGKSLSRRTRSYTGSLTSLKTVSLSNDNNTITSTSNVDVDRIVRTYSEMSSIEKGCESTPISPSSLSPNEKEKEKCNRECTDENKKMYVFGFVFTYKNQ